MMRSNKKRLKKLAQQIEFMPIATEVEDDAFAEFCETGELPEHQRLATAVCRRALRGEEESVGTSPGDWEECIKRLAEIADLLDQMDPDQEEETQTKWVSPRVHLFHEAVNGTPVIRVAARSVLKLLVWGGGDVRDPQLIDESMPLPEFGSVGLHLLGWPECIIVSPYKLQGRRLLARLMAVRERLDHDDRQWFDDLDVAASRFLREGELPDDKLMREAVLANGEWHWLLAQYLGEGDGQVMSAFDRAARGRADAKAVAIEELQAMAMHGRLCSAPAYM